VFTLCWCRVEVREDSDEGGGVQQSAVLSKLQMVLACNQRQVVYYS
jgi:hypothetical protein